MPAPCKVGSTCRSKFTPIVSSSLAVPADWKRNKAARQWATYTTSAGVDPGRNVMSGYSRSNRKRAMALPREFARDYRLRPAEFGHKSGRENANRVIAQEVESEN